MIVFLCRNCDAVANPLCRRWLTRYTIPHSRSWAGPRTCSSSGGKSPIARKVRATTQHRRMRSFEWPCHVRSGQLESGCEPQLYSSKRSFPAFHSTSLHFTVHNSFILVHNIPIMVTLTTYLPRGLIGQTPLQRFALSTLRYPLVVDSIYRYALHFKGHPIQYIYKYITLTIQF